MTGAPIAATDDLLEWRREFPSLDHVLHFVSHSLGAMPRGVAEGLADYARTWGDRGIRAWEERWMRLPVETADVLAAIVHAAPGSIAMTENVTIAQAIALSAVEFAAPKNRLVCTAEDFPSVLYLYEGLARRGAEVVRVPARDVHRVVEDEIVRAIDERTAIVALSHVLFRTSQVVDLAPIVAQARAAGALVLLDAYQSVGSLDVDATALGVDFMTGGSVKWLCGGPGAGWLYVRPELAPALVPALTGWFAHERPFDFDSGPTRRDAGPRRFWTGTPGIPSFVAARPGYDVVARIGTAAIRAKSLRQTQRMIDQVEARGIPVVSPREAARRGGTVVLAVPEQERVCARLLADGVLLDHRPGVGLRLAPHFYTRDDEVDLVVRKVHDQIGR